MSEQKKQVESLIAKAESARSADEAMKYAQAALNAANAIAIFEVRYPPDMAD